VVERWRIEVLVNDGLRVHFGLPAIIWADQWPQADQRNEAHSAFLSYRYKSPSLGCGWLPWIASSPGRTGIGVALYFDE
jgi:hypothetical protein